MRRVAREVTAPVAVAVLQIFSAPEAAWPVPAGSESVSASTVTGAAAAGAAQISRALVVARASLRFTPADSADGYAALSLSVRSRSASATGRRAARRAGATPKLSTVR